MHIDCILICEVLFIIYWGQVIGYEANVWINRPLLLVHGHLRGKLTEQNKGCNLFFAFFLCGRVDMCRLHKDGGILE